MLCISLICSSLLVSQVISINKAINTQEVAVKEKHARNILTLSLRERCSYFPVVLCVCVCVCVDLSFWTYVRP